MIICINGKINHLVLVEISIIAVVFCIVVEIISNLMLSVLVLINFKFMSVLIIKTLQEKITVKSAGIGNHASFMNHVLFEKAMNI